MLADKCARSSFNLAVTSFLAKRVLPASESSAFTSNTRSSVLDTRSTPYRLSCRLESRNGTYHELRSAVVQWVLLPRLNCAPLPCCASRCTVVPCAGEPPKACPPKWARVYCGCPAGTHPMTPQSERQLIACMRRVASVVWLSCGRVDQLIAREHGRERVLAELPEPHRIAVRSLHKRPLAGRVPAAGASLCPPPIHL